MNKPLVSIGLPTFNRATDLQACLANLTNLDYKNIEIIISDNHSTDTTAEVSKQFVKKDKRIRYYRQKSHLAGEKNFVFVLEKANGKYFFLASDDDIRSKTYISDLVLLLEQNENATLAITDTTLFTKELTFSIPVYFRLVSHPALSFYTYLLHSECVSILLYGMHRRSQLFTENFRRVMNENRPFGIQGYDNSLAIFLLLRGDLLYVPKNLFFIRDNGLYLSVYQQLSHATISKVIFQKSLRYLLFPIMFACDWYYGSQHIYRSPVSSYLKPLFFIGLTGKLVLDNVLFFYSIMKAGALFALGLIRKSMLILLSYLSEK
jgi:glycosyltransferase involved in cell wall biosynthesis